MADNRLHRGYGDGKPTKQYGDIEEYTFESPFYKKTAVIVWDTSKKEIVSILSNPGDYYLLRELPIWIADLLGMEFEEVCRSSAYKKWKYSMEYADVFQRVEKLRKSDGLNMPPQTENPNPEPPNKKRVNLGTEYKIKLLREYRRSEYIRMGRYFPSKTTACNMCRIDPKTAKKNAPELWASWDDDTYDMN